ncbi:MAG TPA: ion transporter [Candidatus Paceibacterota bacterium]|uniref:Ion transport domain-containing protein n=1 Tax=Candidatus Ryanbacteria bacterium RIFCSPHIGHO2_01_FULL_48_27 TaxID=1802115 RepID=A0A1G2FZ68_9BACT|nr:MAG: hypothetical protein A2756_05150 [Candidatus Ryanbacteria bacterium RIFCSPHIGHO2_01_FULL_48_27]
MKNLRQIFQDERSRESYVFNIAIGASIFLSTLFIVLETVPDLAAYKNTFFIADIVFTTLFLFEYILRIFYTPKRWKYIRSPLGLIDLLSFLPSLLIFVFPPLAGLQELRVLRVVRILRLLRLFRIYKLITLERQKDRGAGVLGLIRSVDMEIYFLAFISTVTISGTLMHLIESKVPGTEFTSIPQGMWFAIVTISTIGYGDLVPITPLGKIAASLTMIAGLILLALLISVVGKSAQTLLFGSPIEDEEKLLSNKLKN